MNVYSHILGIVQSEIEQLVSVGSLPEGLDSSNVSVEPPRDPTHGDLSTNAAMVLAKPAAMKPRDIGELLAAALNANPDIATAEVAGPGFVNLRLQPSFWRGCVREILETGPAYGNSTIGGGVKINVEYVSANPTGPMHVGHGRGAVVGDALAALLEKVGYSVTREYYINDAGAQVDQLAYAAYWRYLEAVDHHEAAAASFAVEHDVQYKGDYLVPIGRALVDEHGAALVGAALDQWLPAVRDFTLDAMMALVRDDLDRLGIAFDVFTSERSLAQSGAIVAVVDELKDRDLVYTGTLEPPKGKKPPDDWEAREQLLFRATQFGDDVDRPLQKSDGSRTYFASDIAYHRDKYRRGFASMVDVWGADHKGYVKRMQAAVRAVTGDKGALDVRLSNLVNLMSAGEPVKMSKRSGTFVTLREVVNQVGAD
ncbi:MAG: arginine--tRNA ligase, partial [Alphaproteobacteria bacterium]